MWFPERVNSFINDRFGSKRALLNAVKYNIMGRFGVYRNYEAENLNIKPGRYVFVCMGNICRSPLAEAVAKAKGFSAASFGLDTKGGDSANARAIVYAREVGLDLCNHKTQKLAPFRLKSDDVIVAMEPKHLTMYKKYGYKQPIILLGTSKKPKCFFIADPFSTNDKFFHRCENAVKDFTEALLDNE